MGEIMCPLWTLEISRDQWIELPVGNNWLLLSERDRARQVGQGRSGKSGKSGKARQGKARQGKAPVADPDTPLTPAAS